MRKIQNTKRDFVKKIYKQIVKNKRELNFKKNQNKQKYKQTNLYNKIF